jgi:hypothetical protein
MGNDQAWSIHAITESVCLRVAGQERESVMDHQVRTQPLRTAVAASGVVCRRRLRKYGMQPGNVPCRHIGKDACSAGSEQLNILAVVFRLERREC